MDLNEGTERKAEWSTGRGKTMNLGIKLWIKPPPSSFLGKRFGVSTCKRSELPAELVDFPSNPPAEGRNIILGCITERFSNPSEAFPPQNSLFCTLKAPAGFGWRGIPSIPSHFLGDVSQHPPALGIRMMEIPSRSTQHPLQGLVPS